MVEVVAGEVLPVVVSSLSRFFAFFELDDDDADGMIARYKAGNVEVVCEDKMQPSIDKWHELISQKSDINVDVYVKHGEQWIHHKPFLIHVSSDSIDNAHETVESSLVNSQVE